MIDLGHWHWTGTPFDINDWLGFIYIIRHGDTRRAYIGRKQFWYKRGRYWYESDWKIYTGSSNWLNKDLQTHGLLNVSFEMLSLHKTKSSLKYAEIAQIVRSKCLELPQYWYNRSIDGLRGGIAREALKEDFGQ